MEYQTYHQLLVNIQVEEHPVQIQYLGLVLPMQCQMKPKPENSFFYCFARKFQICINKKIKLHFLWQLYMIQICFQKEIYTLYSGCAIALSTPYSNKGFPGIKYQILIIIFHTNNKKHYYHSYSTKTIYWDSR